MEAAAIFGISIATIFIAAFIALIIILFRTSARTSPM